MKKLIVLALCVAASGCATSGRPDWRKIGTAAVAVGATALILSTTSRGDNNHRPCPNTPRTCH